MCDCALMGVPDRTAVEREQLVVCRFRTGSLGVAAPSGLDSTNPPTNRPNSFWGRLKLFFSPPRRDSVRAVCLPPGAWPLSRCSAFQERARGAVAGASRRPAHVDNEPFPQG